MTQTDRLPRVAGKRLGPLRTAQRAASGRSRTRTGGACHGPGVFRARRDPRVALRIDPPAVTIAVAVPHCLVAHTEETNVTLADGFGTGQVFWSMLWFFLWVIWFWLLIVVFGDIFRSEDLGGWGKALWSIFVIVVPYLGVFVYLIARGSKMHQRQAAAARAHDAAMRQYVQSVAGSGAQGGADELTRLAELRDKGVLTEAEFEQAKAKALA